MVAVVSVHTAVVAALCTCKVVVAAVPIEKVLLEGSSPVQSGLCRWIIPDKVGNEESSDAPLIFIIFSINYASCRGSLSAVFGWGG